MRFRKRTSLPLPRPLSPHRSVAIVAATPLRSPLPHTPSSPPFRRAQSLGLAAVAPLRPLFFDMSLALTEAPIPADFSAHPHVTLKLAPGVSVQLLAVAAGHYADNQQLFPGVGWSKAFRINDGANRAPLKDTTTSLTLTKQLLSSVRLVADPATTPSFTFSDDDLLLAAFGLPVAAAQPLVLSAWQLNDLRAALGLVNAAALISSCPAGTFPASAGVISTSALLTAGSSADFLFQLGDPPIRTITTLDSAALTPSDHEALIAQFEEQKAASQQTIDELRAANDHQLASLRAEFMQRFKEVENAASVPGNPGPLVGGFAGSSSGLPPPTSISGSAKECGNGQPLSAVLDPAAGAPAPFRPSSVDSSFALSGVVAALRGFGNVTVSTIHGIIKRQDGQVIAMGQWDLTSKGSGTCPVNSTAELNVVVEHVQRAYRELISSAFVDKIFGQQLWPALIQVEDAYVLEIQVDYFQSNLDALQLAFRSGSRGIDLTIDWVLLTAAQQRLDRKRKLVDHQPSGKPRDSKRDKPTTDKALIPPVLRDNAKLCASVITPEMRLSWCQNQARGFKCATKDASGKCPFRHVD